MRKKTPESWSIRIVLLAFPHCSALLVWFAQCCCFGLLRSLQSAGLMLSLNLAPLTSVCHCFVPCGCFWFTTIGSQILEPLSAVFAASWRNRKGWLVLGEGQSPQYWSWQSAVLSQLAPFLSKRGEKKGAIPRVCCFSLPQNYTAQQWCAWYRTATQPCPHSPKAPPPASKFRTFRKSPLRSLGPTFSLAGLTLKLCQVAQSFLLIFSISRNGNFIATYFNVQPPSLWYFFL